MRYLDNIKAKRKEKGITQLDMSDRIGLAKNNYGKLESGQVEMTVKRLYQIAEILDTTPNELLGIVDIPELQILRKENEELRVDLKKEQETVRNFNRIFNAISDEKLATLGLAFAVWSLERSKNKQASNSETEDAPPAKPGESKGYFDDLFKEEEK